MADRPEGFESVEEVAQAVAAYNPHRPPPRDLDGLRRNLRRRDDGRYRWHWDPALINGPKSLISRRDPTALNRAAEALRIPCLLVRGRHSDLLTEDGVFYVEVEYEIENIERLTRVKHGRAGQVYYSLFARA